MTPAEIQGREGRAGPTDDGYFPFELKPIPAQPTHCRDCDAELEPLRRYGGLCKACVRARPAAVAPMPAPRLRIVRQFIRRTRKGREHWVQTECGCGARRKMPQSTYDNERPECCKRCRLRRVQRRGFEAEYAR